MLFNTVHTLFPADDAVKNYFFGSSSLSVDVVNLMNVAGSSIDDYLNNLASEFLRIMNIELANEGLATIDVGQFGPIWQQKLAEALGESDAEKKE